MTALLLALIVSATPANPTGLDPGAVVSLPPHIGLVLSPTEAPGVAVFLPWVLKFYPEGGGLFRPTHLVLEAGAVFRAQLSFTARGSLRWQRGVLPWLALGGGLGGGLEAGTLVRPGTSVELVARLGKGPTGFAMLTTRGELRMDGSLTWMVAVGGTYW